MAEAVRLPLAGVRVVELSTAWAGPMLGRILAHHGADVVKIETLDAIDNFRGAVGGDDRNRYPDRDPGERPYDRNAWFNTQNIGKRSLGIDVKAPAAREAVDRLIRSADVVISNFAGGALARAGLDYASLVRIRPDVILVEMCVTGEGGPLEGMRGVGPTMEAIAGMTPLTGYGDGVPQRTGPAYVDPIGALNAAVAAFLALSYRRRTGRGQRVEVAQRESLLHWYGERLLAADVGVNPPAQANFAEGAAPHDAFRARGDDEWIAIGVFSEDQWHALCAVLGAPALATHPDYRTLSDRASHAEPLRAAIDALTVAHDKRELAARLQAAGVCAAPVSSGRDIHDDPQLAATGYFLELDHPAAGRHRYQGLPFRLARQTPAPAPLLGEHTLDILAGLGLAPSTIDELIAAGAVYASPGRKENAP